MGFLNLRVWWVWVLWFVSLVYVCCVYGWFWIDLTVLWVWFECLVGCLWLWFWVNCDFACLCWLGWLVWLWFCGNWATLVLIWILSWIDLLEVLFCWIEFMFVGLLVGWWLNFVSLLYWLLLFGFICWFGFVFWVLDLLVFTFEYFVCLMCVDSFVLIGYLFIVG